MGVVCSARYCYWRLLQHRRLQGYLLSAFMEAARAKDVRDGGHVLIPVYTSVKCAIKRHFEPVHCRELGETRASDVLVLLAEEKMRK